MLHVCICPCLSRLGQLYPHLESKHFKADLSSQMPPGIPPLPPQMPPGQTTRMRLLLGLFIWPAVALSPISKEIPVQGNVVQYYLLWLSDFAQHPAV